MTTETHLRTEGEPATEEAKLMQANQDASTNPAYGHRILSYSESQVKAQRDQDRFQNSWQHASPGSVLVAPIGNHWKGDSWEKVVDMVEFTHASGYNIRLQEIMDRCFNPYDSLGTMRNEAQLAASQGFEWLLMVDNDVRPEPDMLVTLMSRGHSIIAPYVYEAPTGKPLHGPHTKMKTGVQPVRWCVLSMLLIHTNVFNSAGPNYWANAIGADEGYHFQVLWHYGHRPWIDTEQILPVAKTPTYPLATLRMSDEDYAEFWGSRRKSRLEPPDRSAKGPGKFNNDQNEYVPFEQPELAAAAAAKAEEAKENTPTEGEAPKATSGFSNAFKTLHTRRQDAGLNRDASQVSGTADVPSISGAGRNGNSAKAT
jgi:hypothetical protein